MAIIVEDGSIVANANSYIDTTYLQDYASARGKTLTSDLEVLITLGMDYIESLPYKGITVYSTQNLQWPRSGVIVDNWPVAITAIPTAVKDGLCECCIAIDESNDPLDNLEPVVLQESIQTGTYTIYSPSSVARETNLRILNKLSKYLSGGSGANFITINRG